MTQKKIRLPLTREWFEMTASGEKTEDYREIKDSWCRRLLTTARELEYGIWDEMIFDLANPFRRHEGASQCLLYFGARLNVYDINVMTLGYPSKSNTSRIIELEHKGIEIRTGNPDWGAEPDKFYFVIKHGKKY